MAGVVDLLNRAVRDALQLENSLQRAWTVGYLAGQLVRALEFVALEQRVAALEARYNEIGRTG